MRVNGNENKLTANLVLAIYLAIAIFALITTPLQAVSWSKLPFLGGFFNPTNYYLPVVKIFKQDAWPLDSLDLTYRTQLIALDGVALDSSPALQTELAKHQPGESVTLTFQEADRVWDSQIELSEFTFADAIYYAYIPILAGLICLFLALWSFADRLNRPISSLVAILSTSLALIYATYFDFITTHRFTAVLFIAIAMAAGALLQIGIALPRETLQKPSGYSFNLLGFIPNILLASFGIFQLSFQKPALAYQIVLTILIASLLISGFVLAVIIFLHRIRGKSPLIKRHSENLILAILISIAPFTGQWVINWLNHNFPPINPLLIFPLIILPATLMRTSRKFRIEKVNKQVYRSLIYILLTVIFGFIYTALIYILNQVLMINIRLDHPLIIGSMVMMAVLLLDPLRKQINHLLNIDEASSQEALQQALEYTSAFTSLTSKKDALLLLRDATWEIMKSGRVVIYIYDQGIGGYKARGHFQEETIEKIAFQVNDPIPTTLSETKDHLILLADSAEIRLIAQNSDHITTHQSYLFIPIWGNFSLLGWVEIADQSKQPPYTEQAIQLVESLAAQFALVYERIDTTTSIQQRLWEMEIINQISLAVNSLTDLDQLLLTIFNHIQRVVPVDRLSLVLEQTSSREYERVFLYQDNAVLVSTKQPSGLEEDYPEKSALRTSSPVLIEKDEVNWILIPLIQNDKPLGVFSLGKPSSESGFDQILLNLTDPLANLVTSAIIKSELIDTLQGKMRHLEKLNAVSQQLTSTLKMEPLLEKIVNTALDILQAESGSILIPNEDESDLIIRIATGEGGPIRLGRSIPVNKGIAGEAYSERRAVICNENVAERIIKWDDVPDAMMQVKNILAVPLIVQDKAVGVLEIFNKANDLSFTKEDTSALEGFAAQAAIALNNASKYTKADQALEKRIDELTTMQRIDKDLHSSRELSEALQTTLNAALTYTKVKAGSIMLVDTYYHEIDDIWQKLSDNEIFTQHPLIEISAFPWFTTEHDEPYEVVFEDPDALSKQLGLEEKYQAHFIITSRLEDDLYSLLILHLEQANAFDDQDVDFLLGLNNHAMIAIRNSILFGDLTNAINAKNEFISFISHELKNPLTAIKGHADILAKGMAGEINAEQEDFLKTISHNVRRMSTFITDLADQSQIESKSLRFVFDTADVADLVNEVLQSYGQQIKGKSLEIEQNLPADLTQVWCDRQRMIQVLSNLISNAIKYTPDNGKITIAAEHTFNEWDPKGAAEVVHISVQDTGYGIDYEDQPHLFTKFFRGTNEKILKISGTGLGLRISKSLTEMMGGAMWFESVPGEGSTFHFTIPI